MSRGPEDLGAPRPRRPGKERNPENPTRAPVGGGSEDSTFRPNPGMAGNKPRSGSSRRRSPSDSDGIGGCKELVAPGPKWYERILFGRVSSGQLAQFCRQFASYLHAGVDYNKTFSSLQEQFSGTALGPVIGRLRQCIRSGSTLEEAMSHEPQVFSPMFLSMIRVAEARGGVPETLRMMGDHYEARQRLIRQARSAMIYPVIVLVMAGGVIALITIWLLPMFAEMLHDISRKAQLPWASQALLAFSRFIRLGGWWLLPLLMVGIPILLARFYKTAAGKAVMDRAILFMPVFGALFRKLDTSRFARTLSTLLDAGVDVGTSIDLTARVVTMTPIRNAIEDSRDQVMHGKELSVALASTGQFSPDVLAVLATGEETGKIPESLTHVADDYEEQVTHMVKNMSHLIQPLLVLILGGIVLFIILAVLLPYIQILTSLAG